MIKAAVIHWLIRCQKYRKIFSWNLMCILKRNPWVRQARTCGETMRLKKKTETKRNEKQSWNYLCHNTSSQFQIIFLFHRSFCRFVCIVLYCIYFAMLLFVHSFVKTIKTGHIHKRTQSLSSLFWLKWSEVNRSEAEQSEAKQKQYKKSVRVTTCTKVPIEMRLKSPYFVDGFLDT